MSDHLRALMWDVYEERAAILEYDAGLNRVDAEAKAQSETDRLIKPVAQIESVVVHEPGLTENKIRPQAGLRRSRVSSILQDPHWSRFWRKEDGLRGAYIYYPKGGNSRETVREQSIAVHQMNRRTVSREQADCFP